MDQFDRGTWNPVQRNGQSFEDRRQLFAGYPELESEDLRQALAYAAANLEDAAEPTRVG